MHHCVFSYADAVMAGKSRIYSIRDGERQVATVELRGGEKKVQMEQLKGPCNAAVSPNVQIAVAEFVRDFNTSRKIG